MSKTKKYKDDVLYECDKCGIQEWQPESLTTVTHPCEKATPYKAVKPMFRVSGVNNQ